MAVEDKTYYGYDTDEQRAFGSCLCTAVADRLNWAGTAEVQPKWFRGDVTFLRRLAEDFIEKQFEYSNLFKAFEGYSQQAFSRLLKAGGDFSVMCWDGQTCRHVYCSGGKAFVNDGYNREWDVPTDGIAKYTVQDMDAYVERLRNGGPGLYDRFVRQAMVSHIQKYKDMTFDALARRIFLSYVIPAGEDAMLETERKFVDPVLGR